MPKAATPAPFQRVRLAVSRYTRVVEPAGSGFCRSVFPLGALGSQGALCGQALERHRQRRGGVQITEAFAWAGCEVTQFIRRPQWVPYSREPVFDLARALQPTATRRLCSRAALSVAISSTKLTDCASSEGRSGRRWSANTGSISTASRALLGIGMCQNVLAAKLVVQAVEPITGFRFRFRFPV